MTSSIQPARAAVTPRGSLGGGEVLPLEILVRQILSSTKEGDIEIVGGAGCGKTTALRHLAAVLDDPRDGIEFSDNQLPVKHQGHRIVFTFAQPSRRPHVIASLGLAPWSRDDLIEYLLANHRPLCASVMNRVCKDDAAMMIDGCPLLWKIVLDELAADESIASCAQALCFHIDRLLKSDRMLDAAGALCLESVRNAGLESCWKRPLLAPVAHLLRQRAVQMLLATERIVWHLGRAIDCDDLLHVLPRELVQRVARSVARRPAALARLNAIASGSDWGQHAMAASILVAANAAWRGIGLAPRLTGAFLDGARWPAIELRDAELSNACFDNADLSAANLHNARAACASFRHAALFAATMSKIIALHADFTGANLAAVDADSSNLGGSCFEDANLPDATLRRANLSCAAFHRATLAGCDLSRAQINRAIFTESDCRAASFSRCVGNEVDFRESRLDGASFRAAALTTSIFDQIVAEAIDFRYANLTGGTFTASRLRDAAFRGANLAQAGLANIDWEEADLRGVDFSNASFHLGSSRSGLVGSTIACEGSRTGFYTDEYDEQDYKSPEEIRKANLCGADLRGAIVEKTDWYLVDLRGAKYSRSQAEHFRRCRAILS